MEGERMGVVLHCGHEFKQPYLPPPKHVKQLLTVRFHTRSYQRIVYQHDDDSPLLISTHLHSCSPTNLYTRSRNPYCQSCMLEIVFFLVGRHGYSFDEAVNEFFCFFSVVQHKVNSMLLGYRLNDGDYNRTLKFNEVFCYDARVIAPHRVCSEDEYRTLVADGEVFEPLVVEGSTRASSKLAAIKGLETVDDVQELLAKEDDICAICLDEFSVIMNKNNNEEKEDDRTLNKEVTTHDYDDDDNDDDDTTKKKLTVRLPCKHIFHRGCIGEWVQRNHVCPCCRFRLSTDDGR